MRNQIDNNLTIICEDDKTMDIIKTMIYDKDENNNRIFTMSKLLPNPKEFSDQLDNNEYGDYWRRAIWGTKLDVYNCHISDSGNAISLSYQTAWSPNKQWVETLCQFIQRMLNYLDKEQPRISVHFTYTNFIKRIGGVFDWVPFKNPFSEKYPLLEYALLYDKQLYRDLSELSAHCIPKKNYTGQIPKDRIPDEFLDEADEEIPF